MNWWFAYTEQNRLNISFAFGRLEDSRSGMPGTITFAAASFARSAMTRSWMERCILFAYFFASASLPAFPRFLQMI